MAGPLFLGLTPPEKDVGGRPRRTDWQAAFLENFALHGIKSRAAKAVGVHVTTVDDERQRDEDFAVSYARAHEEAADVLETFAHKWATTGLDERHEEITYDEDGKVAGKKVRVTSNVSPALLIFMLKAMRPAKYRENLRVEQTGAGGGPIRVKVEGAAEQFFEELDRLASTNGAVEQKT